MAQRFFTDMLGRQVTIEGVPQRIVSLVPSQTELLYDLGLRDEVVGITKFCVHPDEWFRTKRRVGGTKTVHTNIVGELNPDLIIANKEENTQADIEALATRYPVWVSDIHTIAQAQQMIGHIGAMVGREEQATALNAAITNGFAALAPAAPRRVAYFIWRNPWMCAGGDTFISNIIERLGWTNVLKNIPRYPEVALESLAREKPDLVLLSSEPYPFKDKHIAEIKAVMPGAEVMLVDGEMFSWYGSRLLQAPAYFATLLNSSE
jgi:ABC-type Fe3+-hydroxamate transport system substrate-binding protein